MMVAGIVTLFFGCERSAKTESSNLPTPETDPLAQPKSLQQVGAPVEMTREKIPADNPQTPEKISLGQRLFLDRRLSVDGTVSCSTCHDPKLAFTDRRPTSFGVKYRKVSIDSLIFQVPLLTTVKHSPTGRRSRPNSAKRTLFCRGCAPPSHPPE